MQYESKVTTEICCDLCNMPAHTHFACPACGNGFAATDVYGEYLWEVEDGIFKCIDCETKWEIIKQAELAGECIITIRKI